MRKVAWSEPVIGRRQVPWGNATSGAPAAANFSFGSTGLALQSSHVIQDGVRQSARGGQYRRRAVAVDSTRSGVATTAVGRPLRFDELEHRRVR